MLTSPCKDCPDRHENCHSECEKYIAYDIMNGIIREQKKQERQLEDDLYKTSRHSKSFEKRRRRSYADSRGGY